jgi:hypothetical protein
LKKTILLIACLCCLTLCISVLGADTTAPKLTILREDSGKNVSLMNLSLFTTLSEFGLDGLHIGEAVKFTAPKAGWKLRGVQVAGWSGFNNTTKVFPADKNFLLEIRDKDLNLLYKFADAQNGYFLSPTGPVSGVIEIPALPVTGDFYVVFYDRASMEILREQDSGIGKSFYFGNGILEPAERTIAATNQTYQINWLIEALGE